LGGFNVFAYVGDTNWWLDVLGLVSLSYSPAKYKQEWDKARKSYWLEQLERNPNRFLYRKINIRAKIQLISLTSSY